MKCEKKGNLVNRQVTVGQEDLEQINRLTRREFSQEELYCFRVVLCDNDVDRQMERFDEAAELQSAITADELTSHEDGAEAHADTNTSTSEDTPQRFDSIKSP